MERNIQKNGMVNLLLLLVVGGAGFAMARFAHSLSGQVAAAFLGLGFLVAAMNYFQMRLEERERLEKLEVDELARSASGSALFTSTDAELFLARKTREQFERYFVPIFSVLLFVAQGAGAYFLGRWTQQSDVETLVQPLVAMAVMGLLALVLFILGKYSANLARMENQRLLGPGASYLLLGAYLLALVVLSIVAFEAGFLKVDLFVSRALCVLLAILALENFISLLLEIYRPRVAGKIERVLYESRLVGLLSRPEGLFTTAAQTLDYQFGFKVSDTWFYQFLQGALPWLVLAQVGLLLLSSCFVFIDVGEQGLQERFGKPVGDGVLNPGLHLKLPWRIDRVYRYRTEQIQTFEVGGHHDEEDGKEDHSVGLWTVSHAKNEFLLLVANHETSLTTTNAEGSKKNPPVSLIASSIPVQYRIKDLRAWAYNHKDAGELLEHIGTREVVRYLVNADYMDIMSKGRFTASEELQRRIQARADALKLGVKIVFVGLQDIHPPVKVAASYEAIVSAKQKREAAILSAKAFAIQTGSQASADGVGRMKIAEAESKRTEVNALAREAGFANQVAAYQASPEVYMHRSYLQSLLRGGASTRKYILATTNTTDVIQVNLEDKTRPDLSDVMIPAAKAK